MGFLLVSVKVPNRYNTSSAVQGTMKIVPEQRTVSTVTVLQVVTWNISMNEDTAWLRRIALGRGTRVVAVRWRGFCVRLLRAGAHFGQPMQAAWMRRMWFSNCLAYDLVSSQRFDVVVFGARGPAEECRWVIGLPSARPYRSRAHGVYRRRAAPRRGRAGAGPWPEWRTRRYALKRTTHFLLATTGDSSEDSRFANIGNVKRGQIQGKVCVYPAPLKLDSIHS